jgi:enoyl-CoA hydratase/carnithine racemase
VVFISSKADNFIAGADINMLKNTKDFVALKRNLLEGHAFFDEMKKSGKPLVAAINGACLGGGLEWAMYWCAVVHDGLR